MMTVNNGLGGQVDYIEFVSDQTVIEFCEVEWDDMKHIKMHMPVIHPDPYDTVIRIILKTCVILHTMWLN